MSKDLENNHLRHMNSEIQVKIRHLKNVPDKSKIFTLLPYTFVVKRILIMENSKRVK